VADLVHRGHDQIDLLGELVGIVPRRLAGKLELVTEQRISRVFVRGGGPQQRFRRQKGKCRIGGSGVHHLAQDD